MFLRRPSPLSLKVRSKFAELLLLPKKDVFALSKSFSNIWRKIHSKDFHNMISIKHKTFKILNKYIEINGFQRVEPVDISRYYNLDETRKFRSSEKNILFKPNLYSIVPNRRIIDLVEHNNQKNEKQTFIKNSKKDSKKSFKTFIVPKNNLLKIVPNEVSKTSIVKNENIFGKINSNKKLKKSTFSIHSARNNENFENLTNVKIKNKAKTKVETKIETKKETKVETKIETKNETKIGTKIEPKNGTKIESKRETKIESKIGTKVGTKLENKNGIKIEKSTENSNYKNTGVNKDNKDNKDECPNTPQQTESLNPSKFTKEKILEIKEVMKKTKKKENKRNK